MSHATFHLKNVSAGNADVHDHTGTYRGVVRRIEWITERIVTDPQPSDVAYLDGARTSHKHVTVTHLWEARRPRTEGATGRFFPRFKTRAEAAASLVD